jgi:hypothetical protein
VLKIQKNSEKMESIGKFENKRRVEVGNDDRKIG